MSFSFIDAQTGGHTDRWTRRQVDTQTGTFVPEIAHFFVHIVMVFSRHGDSGLWVCLCVKWRASDFVFVQSPMNKQANCPNTEPQVIGHELHFALENTTCVCVRVCVLADYYTEIIYINNYKELNFHGKKDKHLKIPESGAANRLKGKVTDEQIIIKMFLSSSGNKGKEAVTDTDLFSIILMYVIMSDYNMSVSG